MQIHIEGPGGSIYGAGRDTPENVGFVKRTVTDTFGSNPDFKVKMVHSTGKSPVSMWEIPPEKWNAVFGEKKKK